MGYYIDEEFRTDLIEAVQAKSDGVSVTHNDEHLIAFERNGMRQIVESKDQPEEMGADFLAGLIAKAWK